MQSLGTQQLLALDEPLLLRQCRVEFYKSGGPGGQKRNKTSSAAKITHLPTGIEAHSNDFRSQAENRVRALHRLRFRLAALLRTAIDTRGYEPPVWLAPYRRQGQLHVNHSNPDCARVAAHALDLLAATDGKVPATAALLGVSASSLVKFLRQEHMIWDAACALWKALGVRIPS